MPDINILDIILILFGLFYFYRGYKVGFVLSLVKVVGYILGLMIAIHFSAWFTIKVFGEAVGQVARFFPIISFVVLFIATRYAVSLLGKLVNKAIEIPVVSTVNKLLGGAVQVLIAVLIASLFLWLLDKVDFLSEDFKGTSQIFKLLAPIPDWLFDSFGSTFPMLQETYSQLNEFFAEKASEIQ